MRHDLRQEPYAVVPHVRICAGAPGNRRPYRNHYMDVDLRGPFNHAARIEAGFSELELELLTRMAEGARASRDQAGSERNVS